MLRITIPIVLLGALTPLSGQAQSAESLKNAFTHESQLLDDAIADYGRNRAREKEAIRQLRDVAERLDEALSDANASVSYLRDLEAQVANARDRVCTALELTAQARGRIYDRMERLALIAREFDSRAELFDATQQGLSGMWHLEVRPLDVFGLMNLRVQGSRVSGPYRLSSGRQGSFDGTLSGDRLELTMNDRDAGVIAHLEALVDASAGAIRGTWTTLELASGRPSTGEWLADKVSSREEIDLGQ